MVNSSEVRMAHAAWGSIRVSVKFKIGKQKIGLNVSFDFPSNYLYLERAFEPTQKNQERSGVIPEFMAKKRSRGHPR